MLSLVVVTESDLQNLTRLDKLCVLQNMVIVCCSFPVLMDRLKKNSHLVSAVQVSMSRFKIHNPH